MNRQLCLLCITVCYDKYLYTTPNLRSNDYISVKLSELDQGWATVCKQKKTGQEHIKNMLSVLLFTPGVASSLSVVKCCLYLGIEFLPGPLQASFSSSDLALPAERHHGRRIFLKNPTFALYIQHPFVFSKAIFFKAEVKRLPQLRYIQTYTQFCPFSLCF